MTFTISWAGNDGTFESPGSVVLPLKTPVDLRVSISAKKEGAHTALMTLDNPDVPGHAYRMLDAIVVPYRLTAENGYSVKGDLTPALPGDAGFFVEVPPDVPVLAFNLSNPIFGGTAIGPDKDAQYVCSFDLHWEKPQRCAIANPQPGVWELNVSNSWVARNFDPENPAPMKASPVTVSATALGVDVGSSAAPAALGVGRSEPLSLTLTNRLGKAPSASASSADLGSALRRHATIGEGEQQVYEIDVPKGATSLMVRVAAARGGPEGGPRPLSARLHEAREAGGSQGGAGEGEQVADAAARAVRSGRQGGVARLPGSGRGLQSEAGAVGRGRRRLSGAGRRDRRIRLRGFLRASLVRLDQRGGSSR